MLCRSSVGTTAHVTMLLLLPNVSLVLTIWLHAHCLHSNLGVQLDCIANSCYSPRSTLQDVCSCAHLEDYGFISFCSMYSIVQEEFLLDKSDGCTRWKKKAQYTVSRTLQLRLYSPGHQSIFITGTARDTLVLGRTLKTGHGRAEAQHKDKRKEKRATPPNPIQTERTRTRCQDLQSIMIYDSSHILTLRNPFSPSSRVWHLPTVVVQSVSSATLETKGFGSVYSRREGLEDITTFAAPAAIFTHTHCPTLTLFLRPVQEFLFTAKMLSMPPLSNYDL
ncbi:hypothetical protein MUK42_34781 [Musa troglodytarum]|uniref:Uncharacterized protein n=1 Tax=Musa troglodytarum TaxID=320322 RepID=A0A9E7JAZ8_9LILI|nr:hypothetical protein MUK42_34781 [Musa troglodytarum]